MSGGNKRRRKPLRRLDEKLEWLKAEIAQVPPRPDLAELTRRLKAALKDRAAKAAG